MSYSLLLAPTNILTNITHPPTVVADIVMAILSLVHTAAHYTLLCCRRSLIVAFPLQTLYLIGDE